MALFSVWDWPRNTYKVFATSERVSVGDDPSPPRPTMVHQLGAVPDEHVKSLPAGARFMGYSHIPRGEIVRDRGLSLQSLLNGYDGANAQGLSRWKPVIYVGAAFGLLWLWWSYAKPKRRLAD